MSATFRASSMARVIEGAWPMMRSSAWRSWSTLRRRMTSAESWSRSSAVPICTAMPSTSATSCSSNVSRGSLHTKPSSPKVCAPMRTGATSAACPPKVALKARRMGSGRVESSTRSVFDSASSSTSGGMAEMGIDCPCASISSRTPEVSARGAALKAARLMVSPEGSTTPSAQ